MKTLLYLTILAAAVLVSPALAQSDMYCHKTDEYTDVCKFSDGRVHVQTNIDDKSWSEWYSAAQWQAKKAKDAREAKIQAKKHVVWQVKTDQFEALAAKIAYQSGCESAGYIWVWSSNMASAGCHYSEAAMRIHDKAAQ